MNWPTLAEACHALGVRKTAIKESWDMTEAVEGSESERKSWAHLLSHLAIRNNTVSIRVIAVVFEFQCCV